MENIASLLQPFPFCPVIYQPRNYYVYQIENGNVLVDPIKSFEPENPNIERKVQEYPTAPLQPLTIVETAKTSTEMDWQNLSVSPQFQEQWNRWIALYVNKKIQQICPVKDVSVVDMITWNDEKQCIWCSQQQLLKLILEATTDEKKQEALNFIQDNIAGSKSSMRKIGSWLSNDWESLQENEKILLKQIFSCSR